MKTEEIKVFEKFMQKQGLNKGTISLYCKFVDRLEEPIDLNIGEEKILKNLKEVITSTSTKYAFYKYLEFKKNQESKIENLKSLSFLMGEIKGMAFKIKSDKVSPDDILSPKEVMEMYQNAKHKEIKLLIPLLYETGCRINELLNNTWKNVDFEKKQIKIPKRLSKSGEMRNVEFDISEELLRSHQKHCQQIDECKIFSMGYNAAYKRIKSIGKKALGRDNVHPHILRHSLATNTVIRQMADGKSENDILEELRKYLGHNSIETTKIYVNIAKRMEGGGIIRKYGSGLERI